MLNLRIPIAQMEGYWKQREETAKMMNWRIGKENYPKKEKKNPLKLKKEKG